MRAKEWVNQAQQPDDKKATNLPVRSLGHTDGQQATGREIGADGHWQASQRPHVEHFNQATVFKYELSLFFKF